MGESEEKPPYTVNSRISEYVGTRVTTESVAHSRNLTGLDTKKTDLVLWYRK
jgi:hypothetical protein